MPITLSLRFAEPVNDYQIVYFDGDFDKAGFADIKEKISDFVLNFTLKAMIFDFANLKFINSEGIGYLTEVHTHLIQRGSKLVIVGLNAHVQDVFNAIGIAEIMPIYPSLADYLTTIK